MSKCVLYQPAVHVPLIVRPPGGCAPRVVDASSSTWTCRPRCANRRCARRGPSRAARCSAVVRDPGAVGPRTVAVSENWGFAAFETERYRLVVDEDAVAPCQLFDLVEDPAEDHDLLADPAADRRRGDHGPHVRPFFRTPPAGPSRASSRAAS